MILNLLCLKCMYGVSRSDAQAFQHSNKIKILAYKSPSSLKSLARKVVRKYHMRKKSYFEKKVFYTLEEAKMFDLVRYLDFRE